MNLREPNGTVRMAVSNHATIPALVIAGKEYPQDAGASLVLRDSHGRPRLRPGVGSDGEPGVPLLDATGRITRSLR